MLRVTHTLRRYIVLPNRRVKYWLLLGIAIAIVTICKLNAVMPIYATNMCNTWGLDIKLMEGWSHAESSHCGHETVGYYGRYNIGNAMYQDFCRYTKTQVKTNWKEWLSNDSNNCYVAFFICKWRLGKGWSYEYFFQTWLWGAKNVGLGRWSDEYSNKIYTYNEISGD